MRVDVSGARRGEAKSQGRGLLHTRRIHVLHHGRCSLPASRSCRTTSRDIDRVMRVGDSGIPAQLAALPSPSHSREIHQRFTETEQPRSINIT
jgi:hypothetical protein